jgi:hypothetical protein
MSDDLIEALRLQGWNEAADRIEQLERERDYTEGTNDVLIAENQRIEAKLAKAVEALREIIDRWDSPIWKNEKATSSVINRARIVLAELEGGE